MNARAVAFFSANGVALYIKAKNRKGGRINIVRHHDIESNARRYETKYDLLTRKGLHRLLRDQHRLKARAYDKGDYDAAVILLDLARARMAAGLTDRQREALRYVYDLDLNQEETAEEMGISRQAVSKFVIGALKRITKVYEQWAADNAV